MKIASNIYWYAQALIAKDSQVVCLKLCVCLAYELIMISQHVIQYFQVPTKHCFCPVFAASDSHSKTKTTYDRGLVL